MLKCAISSRVLQRNNNLVRTSDQMDVDMTKNDIEIFHRLRKLKGSKYPANVIVRVKDRNIYFKNLQKKKKNEQVDLTTVSQNADKKIFIHEICLMYTDMSSVPCTRTRVLSHVHGHQFCPMYTDTSSVPCTRTRVLSHVHGHEFCSMYTDTSSALHRDKRVNYIMFGQYK